jgi:hypothetical protein
LLAVTASFYLFGVFGSEAASFWKRGFYEESDPNGIRTRVTAVKGPQFT